MTTKLISYAGQAALAPVWIAQLFTGAKSFRDNPILGSRRFNEWGLHAGRVSLAHRLAASRRARLAPAIAAADKAAFDRDGFIMKRDFLPPALFATLLAQVKAYRGDVREMVQGDTVTRRIPLDPPTMARMPAVRGLIDEPGFNGLLHYAHSSAGLPVFYIQSILTHVRGKVPDPQTFLHSDAFQPSVKAWFFLTDVAADAAPFVYVPGSHRLTPARLDWERRMSLAAKDAPSRMTQRGSFRVTAEELPALGLPEPKHFAVPANTLVIADTYGFHARGPSTAPAHRVEIWAYGRRSPFLPWTGLDVWNIGKVGHWRMPVLWRIADAIKPLHIVVHDWRLRHDRGAFDPDDGG